MNTIEILLAIINGKGHPNFWWEVATYVGNDETETIHRTQLFRDALVYKVNHPNRKDIFIDLWYQNDQLDSPELIGDKFSEFDKKIQEIICTNQNIVLSLQQ